MSQRCLEDTYGMCEWYMRCLDVSVGQVRASQVRIDKARTGQVGTGQDRCLACVLRVSGGCLKGVWRASPLQANFVSLGVHV